MDYPDFAQFRISERNTDWATKIGTQKWIRVTTSTPIEPGDTRHFDVYTVPAGKGFIWCATYASVSIRVYAKTSFPELGLVSDGWFDAYRPYTNLLTPNFIIPAGVSIDLDITNEDIIDGYASLELYGYEISV